MTASVRGVGILQTTANASSFVVPMPSGVEKGDLLIAIISSRGEGNTLNPPGGSTTPAGWQIIRGANPSNISAAFYSKRANASEPDDYTWAMASSSGGTVGAIIAIKSPGSFNVYDVSTGGADTSAICPDVTTTKECIVLRVFAADDNDITEDSGEPAGTTMIFVRESSGSGTLDRSAGASWELLPTGATGTAAFTLDAAEHWATMTICIETESLQLAATTTPADLNRRRRTYVR